MQKELWYRIALTKIPEIGPVSGRKLIQYFETASAVFAARKKELRSVSGISERAAEQIKSCTVAAAVDAEMNYLKKEHISPLFITDKEYPHRLLHCYDAPILLYWRGTADLNAHKILSIVGTRMNTPYGKNTTENIIQSLPNDLVIVSGLALGIDSIAHKAALKNGTQTIGVLAHGLDDMYPSQNKSLANAMLQQGGLLSEFAHQTKADKYNFPKRNRIVAGIADAILVIETAIKGGSMITADLAFNYNREVFALPGKITDLHSSGCLHLIEQNKASVFTSTEKLLETMGWETKRQKQTDPQLKIFLQLSDDEQLIIKILEEHGSISHDELFSNALLNSSRMAAALLNLELQNIITILPGRKIVLNYTANRVK
ncbi:MAG: DNA-protecting protein DprA [Sphingobacteriia bacterium]|nr:MAG: DNA-protecting protein DprA [Sphingobacteriia bacterium]TAG29536.1 MAG: DNA-protecting protein DprA [Sphingobacteriia bacterium]